MIFDSVAKTITFTSEEEEEVVDERQHYQDLVNDATRMMKRIMRTPNENFPSFLFEPSQNDFTGAGPHFTCSYIDMGLGRVHVENGIEIMRSVSKLKSKYKNYFDYIDALNIWQRYYDFVEETYGSFEFFSELVDEGTVAFPLKLKPRLKNAKKNKHLLEIDVPISRIDRSQGLDDATFAKICSEFPDQIEIYEDYYEYITYLSKFNKCEEERLQKDNRVKGFRKKGSVSTPESNAIMEYLNGGLSNTNNYGSFAERPLCDDIEAFHEYDGLNEDLKSDAMGLRYKPHMDINYGILMDSGQTKDDIEVYSALNAAGYDVGIMINNSTMDKKSRKLITRSIGGLDDESSSKKAKKMQKKRRKHEKMLYDQMKSNESVRDILTKNRVYFDPDDNMISFTAEDLFNESF